MSVQVLNPAIGYMSVSDTANTAQYSFKKCESNYLWIKIYHVLKCYMHPCILVCFSGFLRGALIAPNSMAFYVLGQVAKSTLPPREPSRWSLDPGTAPQYTWGLQFLSTGLVWTKVTARAHTARGLWPNLIFQCSCGFLARDWAESAGWIWKGKWTSSWTGPCWF